MLPENRIDVDTVTEQNVVASDQHMRLAFGKTRGCGLLIGSTRGDFGIPKIMRPRSVQGMFKLFPLFFLAFLTEDVNAFVQGNLQCGIVSSLGVKT